MERRQHTAVDERRRQVREDLRTVLRQDCEAVPPRHAPRPLSLDQLAGPAPDLGVRRNPPAERDARCVVVGGEAPDDQVGKQRLFVERRGHERHRNSGDPCARPGPRKCPTMTQDADREPRWDRTIPPDWSRFAVRCDPVHRFDNGGLHNAEAHLCDGWSCEFAGQRSHGLLARAAAEVARPAGHVAEARPVHQRRPGHDEPVRARRGLRHRRRRRDRPRPRPLRAVHRREPVARARTPRRARSTRPCSTPSGAATISARPCR